MNGLPDWNNKEYEAEASNNKNVEKTLRQRRIEICEGCKKMTAFKTCKLCGCFLPVKTFLKHAECPLDKWPKE
jgi:TPP-dependent indolepyruvate ferredoxin oxidoreductase alpha subunit